MAERLESLQNWLRVTLGTDEFGLQPASADASFRRYYRIRQADASLIVMDAPPEHEDNHAFLRVAELMREAGLHVPRVHARDLAQGFLLLEDLGRETYLDVLDGQNADGLFDDALQALIRWQAATRPGVLPPYDRKLLRRELELFPDWYLERHLGERLQPAERLVLDELFAQLEERALGQPQVYVHRDFMPRNLMVSTPNPGVIDFQDAVEGPLLYDVLSLFRDAFISWPAERIETWLHRYHEQARQAGLPVPHDYAELRSAFDWIGVQRHLKVIGIFARIGHRDGKPQYLEDVPRFLGYLRETAVRYPAFTPLLKLLDRFEARGRLRDYAG